MKTFTSLISGSYDQKIFGYSLKVFNLWLHVHVPFIIFLKTFVWSSDNFRRSLEMFANWLNTWRDNLYLCASMYYPLDILQLFYKFADKLMSCHAIIFFSSELLTSQITSVSGCLTMQSLLHNIFLCHSIAGQAKNSK